MDPPTAVIDAGCYKRTVVIEVEEFAVEICQIQEISDAAGRTFPIANRISTRFGIPQTQVSLTGAACG